MHDVRWRILVWIAVAACTQPALEEKAKPVGAQKLTFKPTCARDLYAGFATPQEAFATYAQALNEKDYCRAANTYAPEQRGELAMSALAALAITAGTTAKPNQAAYRARFAQICEKYGLGCGSDQRVNEIVRDLRAGKPMQSSEPKLAEAAQQAPEDLLSDVMQTLADVDPNAIGQLSTTPKNLEVQGERATALGERAGRQGTPAIMIKGARGWMLALH
jgi:hypothetical protein